LGQSLQITLGRTDFEPDRLPFDIAQIAQSLPQRGKCVIWDDQHTNSRNSLLRGPSKRPKGRGGAQQCEQASAVHSAASSEGARHGGTVKPSAFAVLRWVCGGAAAKAGALRRKHAARMARAARGGRKRRCENAPPSAGGGFRRSRSSRNVSKNRAASC